MIGKSSSILSPLRYPGSKRRIQNLIRQTLELNKIRPTLFIEPFAGGASVSLHLLENNSVDKVGLIEIDPLVASFWQVVFSDEVDWLIEQIKSIEITLDKWLEYRSELPNDKKELALACIFMNRTSFSGILAKSAGPLGGYEQLSDYKIDCRFPRHEISRRIKNANKLKDRISFVWELSWEEGINRTLQLSQIDGLDSGLFFYFDPPFFRKAEKLYRYYFQESDHKALKEKIYSLTDNWLLSYDFTPEFEKLYGTDQTLDIELPYTVSANGHNRPKSREIILTNLSQLPEENWE